MHGKAGRFILGVATLVIFACPAAHADTWTFTLTPLSGVVAGPPGSTVGWGYTITNNSALTLNVLNINADPFQFGIPDASIFNFPTIGPNQSANAAFVANLTGLFQFTWDANAPVGFVNSGTFLLSAEWCDSSGNCVAAPDASAAYSATTTPTTPVPEPASALLGATGLALLCALRRCLG